VTFPWVAISLLSMRYDFLQPLCLELERIYFHILYVLRSYALFDMDGNQVPQELVTKVGEAFESILKEASDILFLFI